MFNPERYSLSAAFSNSHIQRKSGGSFLATIGVDRFSLNNPDILVPMAVDRTKYGDTSTTSTAISVNSSLALGYNTDKYRIALYLHQNTQNVDLKDSSTIGSTTFESGIAFIYRWDDKRTTDRIYGLRK